MSAEGFAKAGVTLLESTNITDQIAFGAECDNIDLLKSIAQKSEREPRLNKRRNEKRNFIS